LKKIFTITALTFSVVLLTMCNKVAIFDEAGYDERLSGGMATAFDETSKAFSHSIDGLNERDALVHEIGDVAFEQTFVAAPSLINGGLGPVFNNVSCISCHHNDGKGTPTAGFTNSSLLFRLSIPGVDAYGGPLTIPGFGGQLQDVALFGKQPEANVSISYSDVNINYPSGETVTLRKPTYTVSNAYQPLPSNYLISPRLAPPVFGIGLLQNISEETVLSFADENDANNDGISGKPNYVYNPFTHRTELGRFGLKASAPNLLIQSAGAYHQDMGITNYVFPKESSWGQSQLDNFNDDPELADTTLNAVAFYVKTLAVPARRNVANPEVVQGKLIFNKLNCSSCHKPVVQTGIDLNIKALNNQRIQPFTDLLLHDMGDDLADNRPDYLANGKEWRTTPLWGIGLFAKTNGTPFYLHDGRARTIEEAILWHGGEAQQSKEKFMQLSKADRTKLITFIQSL
jgi:CxxC motif-containing protein (DUF1111 family)